MEDYNFDQVPYDGFEEQEAAENIRLQRIVSALEQRGLVPEGLDASRIDLQSLGTLSNNEQPEVSHFGANIIDLLISLGKIEVAPEYRTDIAKEYIGSIALLGKDTDEWLAAGEALLGPLPLSEDKEYRDAQIKELAEIEELKTVREVERRQNMQSLQRILEQGIRFSFGDHDDVQQVARAIAQIAELRSHAGTAVPVLEHYSDDIIRKSHMKLDPAQIDHYLKFAVDYLS